jgi:hypothetical protein
MSTSAKSPNTIRNGGPGASHENAKQAPDPKKSESNATQRNRSKVSGGGGERDSHHTHDPDKKGGQPKGKE